MQQTESLMKQIIKRSTYVLLGLGALIGIAVIAYILGFEKEFLWLALLIGPILLGFFIVYHEHRRISDQDQLIRQAATQEEKDTLRNSFRRGPIILMRLPATVYLGSVIAWIAFMVYLYFTKG